MSAHATYIHMPLEIRKTRGSVSMNQSYTCTTRGKSLSLIGLGDKERSGCHQDLAVYRRNS
jgi:hypothetical protein